MDDAAHMPIDQAEYPHFSDPEYAQESGARRAAGLPPLRPRADGFHGEFSARQEPGQKLIEGPIPIASDIHNCCV